MLTLVEEETEMNVALRGSLCLGVAVLSEVFWGGVAQAQVKPITVAKEKPGLVTMPMPAILPAFEPQQVPPGRDRFLNTPVLTTDELVEALKTNKIFRQNIARHFNLPEERVVAFVQDALVPMELPADMQVTNYGVTKKGMIYGKKMVLKKGTRVWATRSGDPILKWICSNPLLARVPVLKEPPKSTPVASRSKEIGIKPVAANEVSPLGMDALPGGVVADNTPDEPPVIPPIKVAREPLKGSGNNVVRGAGLAAALPAIARSGLPLLPIAGFAGTVVRSQPTPGPLRGGPSPSGHAVPEPSTLALIGLGLVGVPLLRRRR